jgi:hypothetical protein
MMGKGKSGGRNQMLSTVKQSKELLNLGLKIEIIIYKL